MSRAQVTSEPFSMFFVLKYENHKTLQLMARDEQNKEMWIGALEAKIISNQKIQLGKRLLCQHICWFKRFLSS